MEMARYLVEAHLREGRAVSELAASHGVHRSWIYKLIARYRAEGAGGLRARSRRPRRSPTQISEARRREIVQLREQLAAEGFDAGAQTIHAHLERRRRLPRGARAVVARRAAAAVVGFEEVAAGAGVFGELH